MEVAALEVVHPISLQPMIHRLGPMDSRKKINMNGSPIAIRCVVTLPAGWNWASFLKAAVEYIPYAFEKSDAKERWGSENYFEGASGAGRSLRYTGMQIYRSKVDEPGDSREHVQASDEVERRVGIAGSGRWTKGVGNSLPRLDNKPSLRWY